MADVKILLVEAENIDAMNIKETLESFNYEVPYVASSGIEAIKEVLKIMPDLILLDIVLEGEMNGIDLAFKIKELGIPFIYVTTRSEASIIEKAMATEPYGYIIKPFDENKLKFAIEHALFRKKMEVETSKQISLTRAINRVLKESLVSKSPDDVARICLEVLEELTDSKFGFIGEVNSAGRFEIIKISDSGWAASVIPKSKAMKLIKNIEIRGYWTRAIRTKKFEIVNDPASDPERIGEPDGHPTITSFMSVPLKQNDEVIGMIALANKQSPYNQDDLHAVETISVAFLEVLQHKKTEITRQKNEKLFRAVAESAVDAIVTTNVNGIIRYFNHSLEEIFGYKKEELTGKPLTTLMPERYHDTYLHELERFKEIGEHRLIGRTVVTTGLKKDGTEFPFEMSLASWNSGEQTFFTSIIRDLTEKKQAEEELKWSERRLMMAMDIANLVYWEYDAKKDLFTFNDQFYALCGTTVKEQGGYQMSMKQYINRFVAPEERALMSTEVVKAFEKGDLNYFNSFKHWIIRSDGERRFMIVRARYMLDENGEKVAIYGASQDITELKIAEEALAESERRMAEIIDFLPDATFAIDNRGKVISWNRAIEEMTGVISEDILGKGDYEYSMPFYKTRRPILVDMTNSSPDEINQFYKNTTMNGEVLTTEASVTIQGEKKILKVNAVPFYDSKGNYCGGIESIRDVTEMKESRRKINQELEINKSLANIYAPLVSLSSTIEDVGMAILNEAQKLTDCSYGFASTVNSVSCDVTSETLAVVVPDYHKGKYSKELPRLDDKYAAILNQSLANSKSTFVNFNHEHPSGVDPPSGNPEIDNLLTVPVVLGEELVGQITLINAPDNFTDDDLKAIERLAVFYALAIQNKRAEEEIKQSLEDNKILLREVHHRVKNNMQIISSLLNLQINYEEEKKAVNVLKESQGRVKSMSMVHEKLYQSPSFTKIDFKNYVEQLIKDIFYSYGINNGNIETVMDIDNIEIGIDTAIPCGLIINELVTNTVKYAFPQNKGILYIKLKSIQDKIELVIADNGIGLPEDFDFTNSDSLGLQLVNNLVTQIDGQISLDQSHGTAFTISFQELNYKKRI